MKPGIKQYIVDLLSSGVSKPNKILESLRDKGLTPPRKSQLINFLLVHRQNTSPPILSLGSLESYVTNLRHIPEDEDKPYVTHCIFDYVEKWFRVSFSTRITVLIQGNLQVYWDQERHIHKGGKLSCIHKVQRRSGSAMGKFLWSGGNLGTLQRAQIILN